MLLALLCIAGAGAHFGYHAAHPDRVFFRQAEKLWERGQSEGAMAAYRQAVDQGSRNGDALLRLIEHDLGAGNDAQAGRYVSMLLTQTDSGPGQAGELAGLLDAHGRTELALDVLDAMKDSSLRPVQRLHRADLLRRLGRFDEALGDYDRLAQDDFVPEEMRNDARLLYAETLAWAGRLEESERAARSLLAEHPDDPRALLLLARVLGWGGQFGESAELYRRYLGEKP